MTSEGLKYMKTCLDSLKLPFEFMEWTTVPVPETYWVAECTESPSLNEDGMVESTFILTGTSKAKYYNMIYTAESIRKLFPETGKTDIPKNGYGIAISFDSYYPIPSVQEGVHRLQVTLNVKEWRVIK